MALIAPSPVISTISGALGGCVFRRGRGSVVACHRPRASTRRGTAAEAARGRFAAAVAAWSALPASTRSAWAALAAQVQVTDRLGAARQYSGRTLFLSCCNLSMELTPGYYSRLLKAARQPAHVVASVDASASGAQSVTLLSAADSPDRSIMFWGSQVFGLPSLARARAWRYICARTWSTGTLIDPGPPVIRQFTLTSFVPSALGDLVVGAGFVVRSRPVAFSTGKGLPGPITFGGTVISA